MCQKSTMISKKSCSDVAISRRTSELQECFQDCKDDYVQSIVEMCKPNIENKKPVDCQQTSNEVLDQLVKLPLPDTYFDNMQRMDSTHNCTSNLETMFSPALEHVEVDNVADIDAKIAGRNIGLTVEKGGDDFITDARSSSDYQTCTVSDFFISDMIFAGLPFDEDLVNDDINRINSYTDSGFRCVKTNILLDVDDECMMLPILEDTAKLSYSSEMRSCEEPKIDFGNDSSYLAVTQMRSYNLDYDVKSSSDQAEEFDFQFFVKRVPELSDMVPNSRPSAPKESRTKSITLVLDLDETLIHSRLEHCDDADFTFNMFFGMKDHVVYVKQRPHLHTFLKRVAELFEVVIFTASESIYAGQLLDRLDPEGKLISWRIYRESCIFSDGSYTKDLTILGVDLAKVVIIDNTPQVFRLQVNNGIPIKSWFGDPSDCALISLLPFLETFVDVDDVRPIIAKRFGNKE